MEAVVTIATEGYWVSITDKDGQNIVFVLPDRESAQTLRFALGRVSRIFFEMGGDVWDYEVNDGKADEKESCEGESVHS
jgi:hypothetical protein